MGTQPFHNRSSVRRRVALAAAPLALSLVIAAGGGEAPAQLDRVNAKQDDLQAEIDEANRQIDSLIAEEAELREQEEAVRGKWAGAARGAGETL